ncbi:MAG: ABC transporter ATP-binding protein, partial [Parasporobacterium sp.]|nr:ABC transporter ATP-binding protein [Parasporobacterium sp.]
LLDTGYIALQHLFNILCLAIPFIIGAPLVQDRVIRVGVVVAFYTMSTGMGTYATNIIDDIGSIKSANGALARVIKVLRLPDESTKTGDSLGDIPQDITIRELSFSYDETLTLDKISAVIPKGKVTAVIGSNGSGKSTLFKLIDRLLEPDSGEILLGDRSAEEFDLHDWHKSVCLVAQNCPMMEGTLRENLTYGCTREISDKELDEAAKKARILELFETLPQGYETKIAAGGENLSGGQRQCVAIARAMLNNPKYLLLDEATSNLDPEKENAVMAALEELMKGRTTVVIAHSLSAIRNADNVIILKDGKITDSGSPEIISKTTDNYLSKIMNRRTI